MLKIVEIIKFLKFKLFFLHKVTGSSLKSGILSIKNDKRDIMEYCCHTESLELELD